MDQEVWKAWLHFTEEALKGAGEARRQFEQLTGGALGPDALARWFSQWMPGAGAGEGASELAEAIEGWWEALGAVPRAKYDALLRQNQALRERLEEMERKIAALREAMAAEAGARYREEVGALLTDWEKATREALDAQAEWAARWFGSTAKDEDKR